MSKPEDPLRNVSDTALWVAIYRAMESERPDALFRDPFARLLGGTRGEEIVKLLPKGRASAWPMIVRTAVMDEIILSLIERDGIRTVVNLAAGLDVRPFRLPLPPSLRWLHVDLPPMIDYLRSGIGQAKPICEVEFVPADLRSPDERARVLERVAAGPPALAVAEGLLIYLPPPQVADLASALAATPGLRWWVIDLAAPKLLKMLNKRWQPHLAAAGAPFVFAPPEGTAYFARYGWKEASFNSLWDEAIRLHRTPRGAWFWNFIGPLIPRSKREEFRRMSGMVLLERA
ncbi:MAG TPA: SAM-dependent methyltransferase [Candidatus Polarisedimenticolaceae bacterium]|nr:SAM-dependent methyltransferase [Candidatus Polarisedimenticolaceae bacterium]